MGGPALRASIQVRAGSWFAATRQAFDLLQPSFARSLLKLFERGKPQLLAQLKDLVRTQIRRESEYRSEWQVMWLVPT